MLKSNQSVQESQTFPRPNLCRYPRIDYKMTISTWIKCKTKYDVGIEDIAHKMTSISTYTEEVVKYCRYGQL